MNLSSDLISQFAKITNDGNERKAEEVTLYGEVVQYEGTLCVKLDGSDEMTPAVSTSTIKVGDRVSAVIKNHTAIITGNFSDPAASSDELHGIKTTTDSIELKVQQMGLTIDKMGVTFTGLADGTTVINGGCIKTGTIDAQYLNLTGAITFADLTQEVVDEFDNVDAAIGDALDAAEEAYGIAEEARDIAQSITIPTYIKKTYIASTEIRSPEITGNNISVYGTFQTIGYDGVNQLATGYMGAVKGMDALGNETLGVALANEWDSDDYSVSDNYVIVTNGGVRLQAGNNNIVVTANSINLTTGSGKKAYYNGTEIGSGGSAGTPVWG